MVADHSNGNIINRSNHNKMKKPITNDTILGWLLTGIFICIAALVYYNLYLTLK